MSVSGFFRDARVKAALVGPRTSQTAALMEEFFTRFTYRDCSPTELLALADLAARAGDAEVTSQALEHVVSTGSKLHLAYYRLGRLCLSQAKADEAASHFERGIAADASFPHNWMGAARAQHAVGQKSLAADSAENFVRFGVRPHGNEEFAALGDLADFLFDSGQRPRALPIYALILSFGAERPRHVVRLAEAQMAAGHHAEAMRMLLALQARSGADPWSNRALALCHSQAGDHAAAVEAALAAVLADPANQGFLGTWLRVLGKSGDAGAMRQALTEQAALLAPADVAELTARLQLTESDLAGAAATLAAVAIRFESRLYYLALETAYAALSASEYDIAASLAAMLAAQMPDAVAVKILRIDICFRLLLWEDAGDILATLPPQEGERPQLAMKRLEYACFTADREAAADAAARLESLAETNRQFMLPVFRYLAEQQDWNGVLDRAISWLDGTLNYPQIGYVLFRAAKHTGRQADLLAAIHAQAGWDADSGLRTLRNRLVHDGVRTLADIDALAADPAASADATMQARLAIRREVVARAEGTAPRQAVFLCTDSNYLCATVVALHGVTSALDTRQTDFFIVADDDAVPLATTATAAFIDAGISLTIVAASSVVGAAHRLFPAYGLFTSGHRLASAAYYRIYFARMLQQRGRHDRALYVDSDIVLSTPLPPLAEFPLGEHPLAARLESSRPEVRRAITHHDLPPGQYFNSGVLLMDLKHPLLAEALDRAVTAIADEKTRLLYHDQCALNLGFRDNFAALDQAWNFPVQENTRLADIPDGTTILHFLDRPKPWSAAYGGEAGPLWFGKWRETAAFIGERAALALFAAVRD